MNKKSGSELLRSGERFSVTMWEYSWLVQRNGIAHRRPIFGSEDEYADWDKVLDELCERGYDCVRIDAFPHLLAKGPNGESSEEFTMLPVDDHFMWGNHEEVTVAPRRGLVDFMRKCMERNIYVGLSSWYNDDLTHRKLTIHSPHDYARIWTETLNILSSEGLAEGIVWVDICNEFPLHEWAPGAHSEIFGGGQKIPAETGASGFNPPWDAESRAKFRHFLTESISEIRTAHPEMNYTFSLINFAAAESVAQIPTGVFDLLEPHIWTTDNASWREDTGMDMARSGDPMTSLRAFVKQFTSRFPSSLERCRKILKQEMDEWRVRASARKIPLVTTEGWATVFYEDTGEPPDGRDWGWLKEVAEVAIDLALELEWQGICTSNFSEPHFEGMWGDVAWHRRMSSKIRGRS